MTLRRCTRSIDGTIPVPALLYDDEELLASQGRVGIYDGLQKSPDHQLGTIHVSTHRLFYVDQQKMFTHSFAMDLSLVTKTEYYAGLFKSSPKVTLYLSSGNTASTSASGANDTLLDESESWECEVCSYRNPPGLSPAAARICALCGVPRNSLHTPNSKSNTPSFEHHISSSLPSTSFSSRVNLPSRSTTPAAPDHDAVACPACTFLNHPSLPSCEICSTPLPQTNSHLSMKSAPPTRPVSPDFGDGDSDDDEPTNRVIKVSFRKGGDKAFYSVLRRGLLAKAWEAKGIGKRSQNGTTQGMDSRMSDDTVGRSGINGILRTVETTAQSTATDMSNALQDLEALMIKAKDMVSLAADLNERLTAATAATTATSSSSSITPNANLLAVGSSEPEEATFIRSSLSQLGLQMTNTPVTHDMMRDERRWTNELARELARVLQGSWNEPRKGGGSDSGGMMKDRGIIALDEVWGGWNRARGVALIPPSTFLSVLPYLPYHTTPTISTRSFPSGLTVLHTPPYSHAMFASRLFGLLALMGPLTTMEIAQEEKLTVGLAREMIDATESDGHICRDSGSAMIKGGGSGGGAEERWWRNIFRDYVWDGEG